MLTFYVLVFDIIARWGSKLINRVNFITYLDGADNILHKSSLNLILQLTFLKFTNKIYVSISNLSFILYIYLSSLT